MLFTGIFKGEWENFEVSRNCISNYPFEGTFFCLFGFLFFFAEFDTDHYLHF